MTLREAIEQNDVASLDDLLLEEPNRIEGDAECITPFQIVHELAMGDARFYIAATYRLNDGGKVYRKQMITSSSKPEGPYEEPVFLDEDGIDPSIFTDDDGRRYVVLNRGARIFEITPDGKKQPSKGVDMANRS